MLDYREHMQAYEERAQQIIRDHERLRMWAYPPKSSLLRQIIAHIGDALVNIGERLQTIDQRQRTRQRLA